MIRVFSPVSNVEAKNRALPWAGMDRALPLKQGPSMRMRMIRVFSPVSNVEAKNRALRWAGLDRGVALKQGPFHEDEENSGFRSCF